MLLKIATNKTRYRKGQIFPFLIAIIVIIVIIAMITVNLGQIGIFKTDASNAADSAALAGASILSAYLLGVGLKSDMMSGQLIIEAATLTAWLITGIVYIIDGISTADPVAAVVEIKKGVWYIVRAIVVYIASWIKALTDYLLALADGTMAWSNANKTALQYAFQNAGIDEPRPTFKQFVKGVYGKDIDALTPETIAAYNEVYYYGDVPPGAPAADRNNTVLREKIRAYTENGFSRFMRGEDGSGGYWAWGAIKPGKISPPIITAGYGWSVDEQANITNSYDKGDSYKNYNNYVEVEVTGNVMYPLRIYMGSKLVGDIHDAVKDKIDDEFSGIAQILMTVLSDLIFILLSPMLAIAAICPAGLMMGDGSPGALKQQTTDNPITVKVKRYKKDTDAGLWKFRYGTVQAQAQGHTYPENDDIDIKPQLRQDILNANIVQIVGMVGCIAATLIAAIAANALVTEGKAICLGAAAACGPVYPLCAAGCWALAILGYLEVGNLMGKALAGCLKVVDGMSASNTWFHTEKHLFETELMTVR